jgi:hypothetical protein
MEAAEKQRIGPDNLPDKSWYLGAFFITLLLAPIGLLVTFVASIYMFSRNLIGPPIAMWASSTAGFIAAAILMGLLNS